MEKRKDCLTWDEYFMGIAKLSGMRSKDPETQVGACIVNADNKILGTGYNGLPIGCSDDAFPWEREGEFKYTKYPYIVHAEQNAIMNSTSPLKGSRIYVTLFPCHDCAKLIIQSGITEVIFLEDKYNDTESNKVAKHLFNATKVSYFEHFKIKDNILIEF